MTAVGNKTGPSARRGPPWLLAGVILFAMGFAAANRFQLTYDVIYRLAADDAASASIAFAFLAAQAAVLLIALWWLPRRWFIALAALAGASILVNLGYGETVAGPLDAATLAWMLGEARQAGHAAGEFAAPLLSAAAQTFSAIALLAGSRFAARRSGILPRASGWQFAAIAILLLAPSIAYRIVDVWPESAERNLYALGWDIATADPPPPRAAPEWAPSTAGRALAPRHILWLVDESVAAAPFDAVIAPLIEHVPHIDFGTAASMGNCSAPSQVALRSGVDVRHADARTDLRRTPSIWSYAKAAGYRTRLIDGQTSGAPQNLLFPPERALIDELVEMPDGIDTDRRIADRLNAELKQPGRSFTHVVLRGVHFQYSDHYPPGTLPPDAPLALQYRTALAWSKRGFFDRLLRGVDRGAVAIVYTSDHGQNLTPGALPHCSRDPVRDEFRVPLIAFLPERLARRYFDAPRTGHSTSQILPATLIWMGYDPARVAARYDADLTRPTARYVWFGRAAVPVSRGAPVEVHASAGFPGRGER